MSTPPQVSTHPPILPEGRITLGVGEGGAPVLVSAQVALVLLLHRKISREGGDIRPVMALYGERRHAAFLGRGQELLAAFAKEQGVEQPAPTPVEIPSVLESSIPVGDAPSTRKIKAPGARSRHYSLPTDKQSLPVGSFPGLGEAPNLHQEVAL